MVLACIPILRRVAKMLTEIQVKPDAHISGYSQVSSPGSILHENQGRGTRNRMPVVSRNYAVSAFFIYPHIVCIYDQHKSWYLFTTETQRSLRKNVEKQ